MLEIIEFLEKLQTHQQLAVITDTRFVQKEEKVTCEYLFYCHNLREHVWVEEERVSGALLNQILAYKAANKGKKIFYTEKKDQSETLQMLLKQQKKYELMEKIWKECRDFETDQLGAL